MLTAARPAAAPGIRPARRAVGFSLIELMVTMTILGFLLAATLPGIGSWMRNTEIRNAAESLANGLAKARNEAVRRNQPVLFSLVSAQSGNPGVLDSSCALSGSSASWVVSMASPAGACEQAASDTVSPMIVAKYAQGDGAAKVAIALKAANCTTAATSRQVSFSGFGRVDTASDLRCILVTHTTSGSSRPLRLVLGSGGNARMCDPAVTDNNDPRKC